MQDSDAIKAGRLTVFYDGGCPLCRREIAFYRNRPGAETLCWVDVSTVPGALVAEDLSKAEALARFHVRQADGTLRSDGAAFASLWAALPGFRFWGRLFAAAPLAWLLEPAYNLFLRWRPRLQAWARRS